MAAHLGQVTALVDELVSQGRAKANHVPKLLVQLSSSRNEGMQKTIIQGLKLFFVTAGQEGQLLRTIDSTEAPDAARKRQKVAADGTAAPSTSGPATGSDQQQEPSSSGATSAEAQYCAWLNRQYNSFKDQLFLFLTGTPASSTAAASPEPSAQAASGTSAAGSAALQVSSSAALMELVRAEQGPGVFAVQLYSRLLTAVLCSPAVRSEVFSLLFTKYFKLADVRYYTLLTVKALATRYAQRPPPAAGGGGVEGDVASAADEDVLPGGTGGGGGEAGSSASVSAPDLARNALDVLCHLPESTPSDPQEMTSWCGAAEFNLVTAAPDRNESAKQRRKRQLQEQQQQPVASTSGQQQPQQQRALWASAKNQRRLYGDAWLALLRLPLPPDVLRKALVRLPTAVIPHMNGPHLLSDFLTHCIGAGGLTGMLALNGVFMLVTRHGLEYPQFFARLYSLLVPEAFVSRHRAQFFRLADIFLSSALVPAYTAAAFAKRFARLALSAPPAGAMLAVAFVHNLVRRHPSLMVLLHNPRAAANSSSGDADAGTLGVDVYVADEQDPAKTRAVESSLWELTALRAHYCPQVSAFCSVLDKDLADRTKTAEVDLEPLLGASLNSNSNPQMAGPGAGGAGSYSALIRGELERKLRPNRPPAVAFYPQGQAPAALFDERLDGGDWAGWRLAPAPAGVAVGDGV